MVQVPENNEQNRLQHGSFTESFPPPEFSNKPFHDLLHTFAQDILQDVRTSIGDHNGAYGYRLDTQIRYEQQLDEILAERDRQRDELEALSKRAGGEKISGSWKQGEATQILLNERFSISAYRVNIQSGLNRNLSIRRESAVQRTESLEVQKWMQERQAEQTKHLRTQIGSNRSVATMEKRLPKEQRGQHEPEQLIALAAAVEVQKQKRTVLTAIGLRRYGNPPFDYLAHLCLPDARAEVEQLDEMNLMQMLSRYLGSTGMQYKKIAASSLPSRREEVAWALAREETQEKLIAAVAPTTTRAEIDAVSMKVKGLMPIERSGAISKAIQVIDRAGQRLPARAFFGDRRGQSPFTIEEWAALPIRPVLVPHGEPGTSPEELAEFLFERVLYAPQVCDRQGSAVGLSPAKRQQYIDNIMYSIEHSLPLTATQYMPFVAIGNPIKRNTQSAALAELDTLRRLSEIAQAVEMFYAPGMTWLIGNEAPAFQGPGFNLPGNYIEQFHNDCANIARMVDPAGKRIMLFNEAEMLWGTPERQAQWEAFEKRKYAELRVAYDDPSHPNHREIEVYLTTYIYPMSTCIDPYRFEAAQGMSAHKVAEVYTAIKQETGSVIRGVGSIDIKADAPRELSPAQQELKQTLLSWALDLTYKYRVTMESREELASFREMIPEYVLPYTMVTKREKLVLYPNSGRGAYFPAHGESVLQRARESQQRTNVTVRPWWQIASDPERYTPMYVAGREEPLYFEEV